MVGAVRLGFYEVELHRKEKLTRYTPYLARELTVGEYHYHGFEGTPI